MKDFRAFQSGSDTPQGHAVGGSAFSLPSLPIIGNIGSMGLATLSLFFLQPWRMIRMLPFGRGGVIGSFFSWGRLAALSLAAMLLLSPSTLQQSFPEWRTLALVCCFVSGLSVLGAISRCCGSAISCAFWVAITLFLGEKAFKPGQILPISFPSFPQQVAAAAPAPAPVLLDGEWEDMVTGEPVSARAVSYAVAPRGRRVTAPARVSARPAAASVVVAAPQPGLFDSVSRGLTSQLSAAIPQAGAFGVISGGRGWQDGAALPDSAYFGGPSSRAGAVGAAFNAPSELGGGGIDQIIDQVGSFFGK